MSKGMHVYNRPMSYAQKLRYRFDHTTPSHLEVRVIPYLVNWLFAQGLPPGWGKNISDTKPL